MEMEMEEELRVKRKTLEVVLLQCQKALQLLAQNNINNNNNNINTRYDDDDVSDDGSCNNDKETHHLCDLLKSRIDCPDFLDKLEGATAKTSVPKVVTEESNSWDIVNENDLWEGGGPESDQEDYVLVKQEDIVDGIACFMAAYLLSLKQTKDLTPNQLQDALSKTFSVKKRKGKLRKAWDGSKVIYNVASWGATAIGIYQNPALLTAASTAFWTSCHVISKLF